MFGLSPHGKAALLPLPLLLLLCGGKRLPVVHKADDFVTALYVYVQIRLPVSVAVFKTQGNRYQVLPCAKQGRGVIDLRVGGVSPWYLNHAYFAVQVESDYVGFPPVSLRNLKGIEQKTAHNAS